MENPPRIFIDTSVLFAAISSPSGGSAVVVELGKQDKVRLVFTDLIIQEARKNIKGKRDRATLLFLYQTLKHFKGNIKPSPNDNECAKYEPLIEGKDCHVLAGAKKYKVDILLTLDKKHFFTQKLKNANLPFQIQTPADFLHDFHQQLSK